MTREEAIRKLQKQKAEYLEEWIDYSGVAEAYDMAIEALFAEAVRGEWNKTENDEMEITGYYCSACDMPTDETTHFCPNCGAKMEGGDAE